VGAVSVWYGAVLGTWLLLLVNLFLTVRVLRLLSAGEALREPPAERKRRRELAVGSPAPEFRAATLAGEVVGLDDYFGFPVVFVFVSPQSAASRSELPMLVRVARAARERAGVELTLVSDAGAAATQAWLRRVGDEDGVEVTLPVLVAPPSASDFIVDYNPSGVTPYHCFVQEDGTVGSRGPVGGSDWRALCRGWEAPGELADPWRSRR